MTCLNRSLGVRLKVGLGDATTMCRGFSRSLLQRSGGCRGCPALVAGRLTLSATVAAIVKLPATSAGHQSSQSVEVSPTFNRTRPLAKIEIGRIVGLKKVGRESNLLFAGFEGFRSLDC